MLLFNWKYDPVRNDEKRLHPVLVPCKKLAESDRKKDVFAWKMLGRLSEKEQKKELPVSEGAAPADPGAEREANGSERIDDDETVDKEVDERFPGVSADGLAPWAGQC